MDAVGYEQKAYETAKEAASKLLSSIGYKVDKIPFVPVSGYVGDNVFKKTDKMPWWTGATLIGTFDESLTAPAKLTNKPFRMAIQSVLNITGVGTVPTGKIDSGVLKPLDKVIFEPTGVVGEVKSIEMHHKSVAQAEPGDNVGINVRGVGKTDVKKGDVMGHTNSPPTVVKEFTGQIIVLQHPTAITPGYTPVFHMHTTHVAGKITEVIKKIDPKTGAEVTEDKDILRTGDAAIIKIVPNTPVVLEKQSDFPSLAKFAIRDMGKTVAAGICLDYVKAK